MTAFIKFLIRILILTFVYFVLFSVFSAILIPASIQTSSPEPNANVLLALLLVSLLNSLVLAYVIVRSRIRGWRLILNVFLVFFGVATFLPQIETAVFVQSISTQVLLGIVGSGFFLALFFSSIAVPVLGKLRGNGVELRQLNLLGSQWLVRLTLLALCYVIIYFTFGYFVAWQSPAVRAYYNGSDSGNFFTQLGSVFLSTPWLPALQFVRGLLWIFFALPVIRMMKGSWWEVGLAVALCFAVLPASQLLIPNPIMPAEVRIAHLWETASSNFLFGWMVVVVLLRWRATQSMQPADSLIRT